MLRLLIFSKSVGDSQFDQEYYLSKRRLGSWHEDSRQLSGGQWQRIALYRTLIKKVPVYLLDEPTASLDEMNIKRIINTIKQETKNSSVMDRVAQSGIFITNMQPGI